MTKYLYKIASILYKDIKNLREKIWDKLSDDMTRSKDLMQLLMRKMWGLVRGGGRRGENLHTCQKSYSLKATQMEKIF